MPTPILALDGGGGRGLFSAIVLAELERRVGRPLHEVVRLAVGTSTGGILALLIASGLYSMAEIVTLYRDFVAAVFPPSRWRRPRYLAQSALEVVGIHAASPLYSAEPLERLLREYLSLDGRLLLMREARMRVAVTTWDAEAEQAYLFSSWNGGAGHPMWMAARGTSAAQTYFEPFACEGIYDTMALTDGGGGENNPARIALAEAGAAGLGDPLLVSVGTGRSRRVESIEELRRLGYVGWAPRLMRFTMGASADWADHTCRQTFPPQRYYRLQSDLPAGVSVAMDDGSARNVAAMTTWAAAYVREQARRLDEIAEILAEGA